MTKTTHLTVAVGASVIKKQSTQRKPYSYLIQSGVLSLNYISKSIFCPFRLCAIDVCNLTMLL